MSHECSNDPPAQPSHPDEAATTNQENTITTQPKPHELQSQLPCLKCAIVASWMLCISPMDICDTKDGQPCTNCRSDGVFCSLPIDPESQHIFARLLYRHTVTGELVRTSTGDLVRRKAKDNVDFWREACRWIVARHRP